MTAPFPIDEAALKRGEKVFRQECTFVAAAPHVSDMILSDLPELAFVGRSNVGKSSLINALTGRRGLARASTTPGRTQQVIFFDLGGLMHLVDLPGYGYAVASKDKIAAWNALVRGYLRGRESLRRVCLLIDARHGVKATDQDMMEMLDDAGMPYVVVLTKCDKTKSSERAAVRARVEEDLRHFKGAFPAVYETSASKAEGIPALRAVLAGLTLPSAGA